MPGLNILGWNAWAPGLESCEEWVVWAKGDGPAIDREGSPSLDHLPSVAKRRLSQLSRMVLEVGHRVLEEAGPIPIIFCSRFGEIGQQQKITKKMIETGEVLPAAFSFSVFNTPVSLLSIHEQIRNAASVNLSEKYCLINGLVSLISKLQTDDGPCLIIFADESLPSEYETLTDGETRPFAMALIAESSESPEKGGLEYRLLSSPPEGCTADHPLDFLRWFLLNSEEKFCTGQGNTIMELTRV